VKLHVLLAFVIVGHFPFTRLVHVLVIQRMMKQQAPQAARDIE